MSILSWQRFHLGLRLVLCGGPLLVCALSFAELPGARGWWMFGIGSTALVLMFLTPAVGIVSTRAAVWLVAVPFWFVRIRLLDVASTTSVEVRPLEDFGGWGLKGTSRRKGLLLAASGHRAVRVGRANGQVFLATTDDPEAVVTAVDAAVAARHGGA